MHLSKRPKSIFKAFKIPFSFKNPTFFSKNRRTASTVNATHFSFRFSRFGVKIGFGVQKILKILKFFFRFFSIFGRFWVKKVDFWPKMPKNEKFWKSKKWPKSTFFGQKSRFLAPKSRFSAQNGQNRLWYCMVLHGTARPILAILGPEVGFFGPKKRPRVNLGSNLPKNTFKSL